MILVRAFVVAGLHVDVLVLVAAFVREHVVEAFSGGRKLEVGAGRAVELS